MNTFSQDDYRKFIGICGLFSSNHVGERATAAWKADQFLHARGLGWSQVIAQPRLQAPPPPPPPHYEAAWRDNLAVCQRHIELLNAKERAFVSSISRRYSLTEKQRSWLADIAVRMGSPW